MTLLVAILSGVIALDHLLALIPSVQANNTFQLISGLLMQLLTALNPPAAQPTQPAAPVVASK